MKKGIDCTTRITKTLADNLKAQGIAFICRYLVPASMAWKRLTKAEADVITAAGINILSVFESSANRASAGKTAGLTDGMAAMKEAQIVGQPVGTTIYFAVDYDAQPKDYDMIEAYLKAAYSQITGYNIGVYGSYAVCEAMHLRGIKYCWQTYAWSKGKKSAYANVYQYKNGASVAGITCDLNESYGNEGYWSLDLTYENAVKVIAEKTGISPEYWISRKNIDPNFAAFIKKIAKAM